VPTEHVKTKLFHPSNTATDFLYSYISISNLMYVWPCIIYENDDSYQLDATIM